MKAGNLVLVQEHHLISLGIQSVTEGAFNHIALAVSDSEVIEANPGGVKVNKLEYKRYAIYECVGLTDFQAQTSVSYALNHVGEKYGYLQDAGFAINFIRKLLDMKEEPHLFESKHKVICSALVDMALREAGFVLRPDRNPGDVTPMSCVFTPKVHFVENHNLWEV